MDVRVQITETCNFTKGNKSRGPETKINILKSFWAALAEEGYFREHKVRDIF